MASSGQEQEKDKEADRGVRFNDDKQEIEPSTHLQPTETPSGTRSRPDVPANIQQELRDLSISMQKSNVQAKRMENFQYEPMSLPPSRVCPFSTSSERLSNFPATS